MNQPAKLPPLLLLHPDDNILVARRDIAAGERVDVDGEALVIPAPVELGHKLARRALVSAQTMNFALRALELEGYIERRPHPSSRRADSWTLTAAGVVELERAREVGKEIFARMLHGFDAKEIAAFEDYLRRCITALGGEEPGVSASSDRRGETTRLRNVVPRQRRQNAGVSSTRNV